MKETMKRRLLSLFLSVALALSLTTGMSFTTVAADQDIVVLYTNDVHCGVDDNIGYAGLALYKQEMLKQTPYVALVDAGDAIQGAPIGTLSDGGYLVDIMNRVGYDFAIPGNHEFDYGMSRFLELSNKLNCGYYSCNFLTLATGTPVFAPYKLVQYGDTTVAFVGVSTPESLTKSTPAYFQDADGNYLYTFCEDESGQRLYNQVQSAVTSARNEGADYVILVGHLGENGSTDQWTSAAVVQNTTGIDACIDGHSHETIPTQTVKNRDGRDITITQTGTKLENIGKMTIHPDGTITAELISEVPATDTSRSYVVQKHDTLSRIAGRELGSYDRWTEIYNYNLDKIKNPNVLPVGLNLMLPSTALINEKGKAIDYATDQYIKTIQSKFEETLKTVLGHAPFQLAINNPATGQRAIRSAETNLGDLCADAFRTEMGADIGLINGGGIRAALSSGPITYNDALTVFPYGNMGCVTEVTGQTLKDALEMASKNCPEESGAFLHVSGLTYTIDTSVKSSVQTDEKGNFTGVNGPYRVTDIMVGDAPLDLTKTYTVASHNYMLKSGGDGMSMFEGSKVLLDETMVDVDILSRYIQKLGGTVTSEYADPSGQGRIIIK